MPLSITIERFAEIRAKVARRKFEVLAADNRPDEMVFASVQDFFDYVDTLVEEQPTEPRLSRKRR